MTVFKKIKKTRILGSMDMERKMIIETVKSFYQEVLNAHKNDRKTINKFMYTDFVQHIDGIPNGRDAFIAMTDRFFQLRPAIDILKIFTNDNDEAAVFSRCTCEADNSVHKAVDIFGFRDGKLAEHWNVTEHNVEKTEVKSGRGLFSTDAPSTPSPAIEMQKDNTAKVIAFNEEIFNAHNNDKALLDDYMMDDYMQHNPSAGDGKEGFIGFTNFFFTLDPEMVISKTFANEEGEVAVYFKCVCKANGMINKVCDIYRLNDGKLAEHWDVVEHNIKDEPGIF